MYRVHYVLFIFTLYVLYVTYNVCMKGVKYEVENIDFCCHCISMHRNKQLSFEMITLSEHPSDKC